MSEPAHASPTPQHFHVSLKAFLLRENRLLLLRDPVDGHWELPGGRVGIGEELEAPETVLARELREELGDAFEARIGPPTLVWSQPLARRQDAWAYLIGYRCEHLRGEIRLSHEHDRFEWCDEPGSLALTLPPNGPEALRRFWRLASTEAGTR